eukprot:NODE_185_length_13590_cov_0.472908.p9 type:complete len:173 gc:universal NODE_185_length_13590_cov_0.472908:8976-8458(-)
MKKKVLILDLDETLVHTSSQGTKQHDFMLEVLINTPQLYYVYKRPYLDYFLSKCFEWYHVLIFTASVPEYADPVIDFIDPQKKIKERYYRNDCLLVDGTYVKDLTRLKIDLSQIVFVDNFEGSYNLQQENAIPVSTWHFDSDDHELLNLLPLLDALRWVSDVRTILGLRLTK